MLAGVPTGALLAVQQNQPDTRAQPQFRATVGLVRVDLYATTSRGPVLDLGQNDFEVYEPLAFSIGHDGPVRAATGEVPLSPLSVGDYLVQCDVSAGSARARRLVAFRIVP